MFYTIHDILRDTRIHAGYNACERLLIDLGDDGNLTIDQQIMANIEPAARTVMEEAPPELLSPGIPVHRRLVWPEAPGKGMAVLPLPDDFLRLLSVRLTDWHRPARIIDESHPDYRWQSSPYAGLRGNPSRPVAVICRQPQGMVVELYASTAGRGVTLDMAQYVPIPRLRHGGMEIPLRLYDSLITKLVSLL